MSLNLFVINKFRQRHGEKPVFAFSSGSMYFGSALNSRQTNFVLEIEGRSKNQRDRETDMPRRVHSCHSDA